MLGQNMSGLPDVRPSPQVACYSRVLGMDDHVNRMSGSTAGESRFLAASPPTHILERLEGRQRELSFLSARGRQQSHSREQSRAALFSDSMGNLPGVREVSSARGGNRQADNWDGGRTSAFPVMPHDDARPATVVDCGVHVTTDTWIRSPRSAFLRSGSGLGGSGFTIAATDGLGASGVLTTSARLEPIAASSSRECTRNPRHNLISRGGSD